MKIVLVVLSIIAPIATSLLASSLLVLYAWPLIYSKVVVLLLFLSLFMTGLIRLAWGELVKYMSVLYELFSDFIYDLF